VQRGLEPGDVHVGCRNHDLRHWISHPFTRAACGLPLPEPRQHRIRVELEEALVISPDLGASLPAGIVV
jgi:hypothetical protein